jgi:hypothetical protein
MLHPLAVCDTCHLIFAPEVGLGEGTMVEFRGIAVRCPRGHFNAHVIDRIYEVLGDTVRILTDSKRSVAEFQSLIDALNQATNAGASNEEIERTIRKRSPGVNGSYGLHQAAGESLRSLRSGGFTDCVADLPKRE